MSWDVQFYDAFDAEFEDLPEAVQDELLAHARLLEEFGPQLGRPRVDTLNGSGHANMKELRFDADDGVWRVAFAFDPRRKAILLVCGDKSGGSEKRFYKQLIKKADERFDDHLSKLSKKGGKGERREIMATNLHDKMKSVGSKRRKKIESRVAELVAEEMALRELRKAHHRTQTSMAKQLGISQDGVSRLEKRSDLLLSTLRGYVEAMGGNLRLVAEFPDQPPVMLTGFSDIEEENSARR